MVKNGGKIIAPVSVQRWALTSDMDGLLDFFFLDIYGLFIKNLDSFPVDLVISLLPSSFTWTQVSRKGSLPSSSCSLVNLQVQLLAGKLVYPLASLPYLRHPTHLTSGIVMWMTHSLKCTLPTLIVSPNTSTALTLT